MFWFNAGVISDEIGAGKYLNTSYVLVQRKIGKVLYQAALEFKYILCFGSTFMLMLYKRGQ